MSRTEELYTELYGSLKVYDIPFYAEAVKLCDVYNSKYLSPAHLLMCWFKYPNFRHLLKLTFNVTELRLYTFDMFLEDYIKELSGKRGPHPVTSNELGVAVPLWSLDCLSMYMVEYFSAFKDTFKNTDSITFGFLLSCILNTDFEEELSEAFRVVFECDFKTAVSRITLAEETIQDRLIPVDLKDYLQVSCINHSVYRDKEFLTKLKTNTHQVDIESMSVLFDFKSGKTLSIPIGKIENIVNYFLLPLTGTLVVENPIRTELIVRNLYNMYNRGETFDLKVIPAAYTSYYDLRLGLPDPSDCDLTLYRFTGDEWRHFLNKASFNEESMEKYLARVARVPDLYGQPELLDTFCETHPTQELPGPLQVVVDIASEDAPVTTETVKNGTMPKAENTNEHTRLSDKYVFGDKTYTREQAEYIYNAYIPNCDKYVREVLINTFKDSNKRNTMFIGPSGTGKSLFLDYLTLTGNLDEDGYKNNKEQRLEFQHLNITALTNMVRSISEADKLLEQVMNKMKSIALETNHIPVLICDNLNTGVIGRDSYNGINLVNILCETASRNNIAVIGACTESQYTRLFKNNSIVNKTFNIVNFEEPSVSETEEIVYHWVAHSNSESSTIISDVACKEAVRLADKFIKGDKLPNKALNLLIKAKAISCLPDSYIGDYTKGLLTTGAPTTRVILPEIIGHIMSEDYKVPVSQLEVNRLEGVKQLDKELRDNIFGQDTAIDSFIKSWKTHQAGLTNKNKPVGTFLFIGPTGVGKTELAKQIAENTGRELVRFDMSEYADEFMTSKLIGSPDGYVNCDNGGQLTNKVLEHPNCVLLLDEIEKAHPNIHNLLLQAMDNAEMTSSRGDKVDFQNVVIIMTSNCGARQAAEHKSLGFNSSTVDKKSVYEAELKKTFTPEFIGRFDCIINFSDLSKDTYRAIISHQWKVLHDQILEQYENIVDIKASANVFEVLLNELDKNESGARGIAHLLDTHIKERLCDILLEVGQFKGTSTPKDYYSIYIGTTNTGKLTFRTKAKTKR